MARNLKKQYSISFFIKEMQIKTMRYHHAPIKMANIFKTDNIKSWRRCGTTRTLIYFRWECKIIQPLWEIIWQFLIRLNAFLNQYLLKINENICPCKYLYENVYSSLIHNSQNPGNHQQEIIAQSCKRKIQYIHKIKYFSEI